MIDQPPKINIEEEKEREKLLEDLKINEESTRRAKENTIREEETIKQALLALSVLEKGDTKRGTEAETEEWTEEEEKVHEIFWGANKNVETEKLTDKGEKLKSDQITDNKQIQNAKLEIEEIFVQKEYSKLSQEDKEKIELGFKTMGFLIEQKKNNFFASVFNKILEKLPEGKTASRFCKELRDSFVRDSKKVYKTAESVTSGKEKHKIANTALLFGNILRYGRIVTDLTGASLASPLRYVMMGSMVFTRASEAAKETRLTNEDVIEKTRIQDADLAAEEAWGIYERAQAQGRTKNVSAEALKNAYMMEMPTDLLKRLENPSTANNFVQIILRKHLEFDINRINNSLEKIHSDPKLSLAEKEEKERKLIKKQEKKLVDYDRILTQYGIVDELAIAGRYAQTVGKAVVTVMTVETLVLSVERMWGILSHAFSELDISLPTHSTEISAEKTFIEETIKAKTENQGGLKTIIEHKDSIGIKIQPETKIELHVNPDAIVHQGQGITQAFAAQMRADHNLAEKLGFHGDLNNKNDMAHFTRQLAIKMGYMDESGHEVRVAEADKVAYEIKIENGHILVEEKTVGGEAIETHQEGDKFEEKADKYEYNDERDHRPEYQPKHDTETNTQTIKQPVQEQKTETIDTSKSREIKSEGIKTEQAITESSVANPFNLTNETLTQVKETHTNNINHFINSGSLNDLDKENIQDTIKEGSALVMVQEAEVKEIYSPLHSYIHKLHEITGLKPRGESLVQKAETNEEYIYRAEMKAASMHKLEEIKINQPLITPLKHEFTQEELKHQFEHDGKIKDLKHNVTVEKTVGGTVTRESMSGTFRMTPEIQEQVGTLARRLEIKSIDAQTFHEELVKIKGGPLSVGDELSAKGIIGNPSSPLLRGKLDMLIRHMMLEKQASYGSEHVDTSKEQPTIDKHDEVIKQSEEKEKALLKEIEDKKAEVKAKLEEQKHLKEEMKKIKGERKDLLKKGEELKKEIRAYEKGENIEKTDTNEIEDNKGKIKDNSDAIEKTKGKISSLSKEIEDEKAKMQERLKKAEEDFKATMEKIERDNLARHANPNIKVDTEN